MLAVVRTPRTKKTTLEIRGQIPRWMMIRLRREYKSRLTIREETLKLEPQVENVFATPWFADVEKQMHPGENLRIYRENAGLSQVQLGEKLGNVPRQNISSMEKGTRGISKETAKKLALILHAPIERFL